MSLLRRVRAHVEERAGTIDLGRYVQLWGDVQGIGYSPVAVTVRNAVTHAASSACIDALADAVSTLPFDAVRSNGAVRLPVTPTPQIVARPSVLVQQDVWMRQLVESMLTDGNAFAFIGSRDALGRPTALDLIPAESVGDRRIADGVPVVLVAGERHALYPFGDVWHLPGKLVSAGSPFADSPVARASATIGAAIAARDFGSKFFGQGGHPGGLITSEQQLTAEQAKQIKLAWLNAVQGNREPAVLGSGLKYQPLLVDPNDSQFLDLMRFALEEACRFWRVPPSMVYGATSGQSVTYANVGQADLHFLKHSLQWLLRRIEVAMSDLLTRPVVARFNRNAFLWNDPEARSVVVDRRLRNETMTVNEARALEDEAPFGDPKYDEPGIPTSAAAPAPTIGGQ